jgi:hypothetical protein
MLPTFTGQPTEVLILGTQHLDQTTSDAALASTQSRLTRWKPDVVAVEVLPGDLMDSYLREGGQYADLQHGGIVQAQPLGEQAQKLTGWKRSEAALRAADPRAEAAQRVLAFLAAYEPWNALLHWTPELILPEGLHAALHELASSPSERTRLGVTVARALGHQQLFHFDDFTTSPVMEEKMAVLERVYDTPEFKQLLAGHACFAEDEAAKRRGQEAGDYWLTLQHLNSPEGVALNIDLESGLFLRMRLPGGEDRSRLADWDARNFFMAARLRLATTQCPGGRLLAVVGNSHKGPLETALGALGSDLRMVALSELD